MREWKEIYSNLFINIAGLLCFYLYDDIVYCMGLQALGSASFVYHYYKGKPINIFDWWGMMFAVTIAIGTMMPSLWGYIIIYQILHLVFLLGKTNNVYIETGIPIVLALIVVFMTKSIESSLIITILLLVSLYIRSTDEDIKQERHHDSWGHSLWHVLVAVDLFLIKAL